MADVDEDRIPSNALHFEDFDLSDETQDFRFLSTLSKQDAKIPKRGEKDFEPHATELQSCTLATSRQAMHNALSFQRIHQPKGYTMATYHPETNMAYSYNPRGPLFARMGQVLSAQDDPFGDDDMRGKRLWLLPEEALYLLERGTIDIRWPSTPHDTDARGLPMSLQGAYAMFLGDEAAHEGSLNFDRYSVYSGLKRMGYTVLRATSGDSAGLRMLSEHYPPVSPHTWRIGLSSIKKYFPLSNQASLPITSSQGRLVSGITYRTYADIYRKLTMIDYHDPVLQNQHNTSNSPQTDPDFRITFNVWKPGSTTFRKSAPGVPDFRISVVNAHETSLPTLAQLCPLFDTLPFKIPREGATFTQRLKEGYKDVILAIVDQGVVSYLRFADAAFGREKLYERSGKQPTSKKRHGQRGKS